MEDNDLVSQLSSLFGGAEVIEQDEPGVTLQSNAGQDAFVPADKTMTVNEALRRAGIEPQADFEYIVDGASVSLDEVVAPGAAIYIHTVVEGG